MYCVGKLRIPTFFDAEELPVIQKKEKLIIRNLKWRNIIPKFFFISTDGIYVSDTYCLDFLNNYKLMKYDYDYCINKRMEVLKEPDMRSNFKSIFSTFNKLVQFYTETIKIEELADDPFKLNSNKNIIDIDSYRLFVPFTIDSNGYVSIDEGNIRSQLADIAIVPKNIENSIKEISVSNITRFLASFDEESNQGYLLVRKKKLIRETSIDYRLKNAAVANLICITVNFSVFNGNPNTIIINY